VIRLTRITSVTIRGISAIRVVVGRKGVLTVAIISILVVTAGGAALGLVEPQTVHNGGFLDGIWWAIVTASTVGYGDIAPSTPFGRIIAIILMLTGIGLISTLAGSITAYFVEQQSNEEMAEIRLRLKNIESLLSAQARSEYQEKHSIASQRD